MRFSEIKTYYNIANSAQSSHRHRRPVPERISGQPACQCCMALLGKVKGRSIPAWAGGAAWRNFAAAISKVYPRVCGGSRCPPAGCRGARGLSPRVRGKPEQRDGRCGAGRSIPACAGESPAPVGKHRICRVYPRVCGGSALMRWPPQLGHGLSPRVRGKRSSRVTGLILSRSIPACAGEAGDAAAGG